MKAVGLTALRRLVELIKTHFCRLYDGQNVIKVKQVMGAPLTSGTNDATLILGSTGKAVAGDGIDGETEQVSASTPFISIGTNNANSDDIQMVSPAKIKAIAANYSTTVTDAYNVDAKSVNTNSENVTLTVADTAKIVSDYGYLYLSPTKLQFGDHDEYSQLLITPSYSSLLHGESKVQVEQSAVKMYNAANLVYKADAKETRVRFNANCSMKFAEGGATVIGKLFLNTEHADDIQHADYNTSLASFSVQRLLTDILYRLDNTSGGTVTGDYLPLSGGTLTGQLNVNSDVLVSGQVTAGSGAIVLSGYGIADMYGDSIVECDGQGSGDIILGAESGTNQRNVVVSNALQVNGNLTAKGAASVTGTLTTAAINASGEITSQGEVTAYATSDERMKRNIEEADCLSLLKELGKAYEFDYKADGRHSVGFIAQNIKKGMYADIVHTDNEGYMKVNYWSPKLIASAIGAIGQLSAKVDALEARLAKYEEGGQS